jgi:FG-GAP repeat
MKLQVAFLLVSAVVQAQTRFKLSTADAAAGDNFGTSVSISGDRIVVGAPGDGDPHNKGKVYIFERGNGIWNAVATLVASDGEPNDQFGHSVAASGDRVVVGAPGDDDKGFASGSAYIFERSSGGETRWRQVIKLLAGDAAPGRQFGQSVSISGDLVVIGSQLDDDSARSPGSAYVFERNQGGPDKWGPGGKLTASHGTRSNAFGSAVSISGDFVVVGAPGDSSAGFSSGAAYLFQRKDNRWAEAAKLTASDTAAGDNFGNSVSIDGNEVVIGAPFGDAKADDSGSAYIFERNPAVDGRWSQAAKLTAPDAAARHNFGSSVSISGGCVAVGTPHDDHAGSNAGSVYLFERQRAPEQWGYVTKLTAIAAAAGDSFGASVSMGGGRVASGAPFDGRAGNNAGSAYVQEQHCAGRGVK